MARRTARKAARGAVPMDGSSIRNEVAAIALVAFALLSLIALFTTEGAVLSWWHETLFAFLGWGALLVPFVMAALAAEMWFGLMRRSMAAPIGGGVIAYAALLALLAVAVLPLVAVEWKGVNTRHEDRIFEIVGRYVNDAVPPGTPVLTTDEQFNFLAARPPSRNATGCNGRASGHKPSADECGTQFRSEPDHALGQRTDHG